MSFDPSKAPAQSEVQAAAMAIVMNPVVPRVERYSAPIPPQNLTMPVSKSSPNSEAAHKKADAARGSAVAEMLVKELLRQEIKLVKFLRNIADLGQQGRTGFRETLKKKQGDLKALLDFYQEDSFEYKATKAAHASATTRMSEIKVFSEAVDMGFEFSDDETYPMIIAAARLFKKGEAMDENSFGINGGKGPTRRRGRPATPFADKFKKFLADNVTEENHTEARDLFNTWMGLQNFGKTPAAE